MLKIHLANITEQGMDLDERVEAAWLPLLNAVASEGAVNFTRPLHVRVHAVRAGETVLLEGTADAGVRIPCSRCLEPFDVTIETGFSTTAVPEDASPIDADATDDIELSATELDVLVYSGDDIDLRDEIAQQIIMTLPFKPLCQDACKGLCSGCGVDLNQKPCQCPAQDERSPFAVLKALSFPKDKE